ncbi:MAG: hypothetical protein GY786_19625 [Proteobacteria bacterium]|nr:hypothetical protein [Pseudomonadota bacterium]
MIDTHCHILPNINADDGATNFKQAIEMARIAAEDGVTKIIATPHIRGQFDSSKNIQKRCDQLNQLIQEQKIPLKIYCGGEIASTMDLAIFKNYTMNLSRYVLVEFPHSYLPQSARETLFNLVGLGLIPIIAHAERNASIVKDPQRLLDLVNPSIWVQITTSSLLGHFGRDEKQCARFLLKKGVVNLLGSDAHDESYRPPTLSEGLRVAAKIIGKEKAKRLVIDNPEAVLRGERIDG